MCATRRWAGSPTSSCPSRPTWSARTSSARCTARCRCSRCATRRSRRASTAVRRGGSSARSSTGWASRQALDFETIEELWNYQLDGTGVTVSEMRETGIVGLAAAPKLIPRDELTFPTPSGKIEIESEILEAGRALEPAGVRPQGGDRRRLHAAVREDGDARARPVPQQPPAQRESARTGALDPPRPRRAARHRRR